MDIFCDQTILHQLLENSHDVFWVRDQNYRDFYYISKGYESVWGKTCNSAYQDGNSWSQAIHPQDHQRVMTEITQLFGVYEYGKKIVLSYRIVHLDNEIRNIYEIVFPIRDQNNKLRGFVGLAKNITSHKIMLSEINQAEQFFHFFTERSSSVFWAVDASCNRQLFLSPGYEKIWGRSRASLYERPNSWSEALYPDDRALVNKKAFFEILKNSGMEAQYEFKYRIVTPDNEVKWIKDTSFPMYDAQQNFIGFTGIAEEITKEVKREQELTIARQRAEVANQAKSDFLAMVSHELRTPLNAILGMAQILKMKDLSAELLEYVEIIDQAGASLLSLVSDILDFARLEAGKLTFVNDAFNLQQLFNQIVHGFKYQAKEKSLELHLKYATNLPTEVIGDPNRVRQILVNLIGNAIKFTDVGEIKIEVELKAKTTEQAIFAIAISDTGIGIVQDKLERIFDKFNQIDSIYQRKHGGIGLGLAIVKHLVEAMHGEIWVESQLGGGSVFTFTLPLAMSRGRRFGHALHRTVKLHQLHQDVQCSLKVLLVEDNEINQKVARFMLENEGCNVTVINDGQAVLAQHRTLSQYDLIFLDIGLPDMSGFDVAQQLRTLPGLAKIPLIALTAHVLDADRLRADQVGIDRVLAKPLSISELTSLLCEYR